MGSHEGVETGGRWILGLCFLRDHVGVEVGELVVFEVAADAIVDGENVKGLGDSKGAGVHGSAHVGVGDEAGRIGAAEGEDQNTIE